MSTESKVRVVTRAGALREPALAAGLVPDVVDAAVRVDVGTEAATDDEVKAIEARLAAQLSSLDDALPAARRAGQLTVLRARVKASPGREQHRYLADCRLRLSIDGDVVAEVEGEAVRLVRARNLSVVELDGIKDEMMNNGGRLRLLDSDDVATAVVDACSSAFAAIATDARPADAELDRDAGDGFSAAERAAERDAQRRRALSRLEHPKNPAERAGALVDLGAVGVVADAAAVATRLHDENALVRRAAESSFTALCAGQKTLAPTSTACVRPAPPPPPPAPVPVESGADDGDADDDTGGPMRSPDPAADPAPAPQTTAPTTAPATTTEPAR